jgi:hypothetical protein
MKGRSVGGLVLKMGYREVGGQAGSAGRETLPHRDQVGHGAIVAYEVSAKSISALLLAIDDLSAQIQEGSHISD